MSGDILDLRIRVADFEGPLELLLHLIRSHEIDIYDIPIAFITEEYLKALKEREDRNMKISGEFIVMAATLMYIKSKTLLPVEERPDEDDPPDDPREELVKMILEYQKYKEAAGWLKAALDARDGVFTRPAAALGGPSAAVVEEKLVEVTVEELVQAWDRILARVSESVIREIPRPQVSVSRRIGELLDELRKGPVGFEDIFEPGRAVLEWIASFLAILEMAKLGLIRILQDKAFGRIEIHATDLAASHSREAPLSLDAWEKAEGESDAETQGRSEKRPGEGITNS